jgi:hypothetical protein
MTDPDDPSIQSRYKYALLVGLDSGSAECFLLLTTSRVEKLEPFRRRNPDAFHEFAAGAYSWMTSPTVLDMRSVRPYTREELKQKLQDQTLTFESILSETDMSAIDAKLRASKTIELKTLRKIVVGVS